MKKNSLLFTFMLLPALAGCNAQGGSSTSPDNIEITDMQNRTQTIDRNSIKRVVCVGAGALRYYSYIGDMSKLVGVEKIDSGETFGVGQALRPYYMANYDTLKNLPIIGQGGPQAQSPDKEKILEVNPDIVVSFYSDPSVNDDLQSTIQTPVIALAQGNDGVFDSVTQRSFTLLGKVFKQEEKAAALNKFINDSIADFASLTETEETYYVGCIGNWGKTTLYGSYKDYPVFNHAKVKNALSEIEGLSGKQVTIDAEKLQAIDPDKIFVDASGLEGFVEAYKTDSTVYDALSAFEDGETYLLMPYNAYYTNLEIELMSTYYVASVAHGENFHVNLNEKFNAITKAFLGKELYSEMKEHKYGYGGYQCFDIKDLIK
jgi:iron complex transport system substrate-binding protein